MRLKRIHLENFQSIPGPVTLDLAPLTLLYGPNSAGKSAIADAIGLVSDMLLGQGHSGSAANWVHMRDGQRSLVVGLGGWQHWDIEDTLTELDLRSLAGAPIGSFMDEASQRPLWAAWLLFSESPGDEIREADGTEFDVLVSVRAGAPCIETLTLIVDEQVLVRLEDVGRRIFVALDHPRFWQGRALHKVHSALCELALDVQARLPDALQDLLQVDDKSLVIDSLFAPISGLGIVDQFSASNPGLYPPGETWWDQARESKQELEKLRNVLIETFFAADTQSLNRLRELLCGLVLIPCRIAGACGAQLIRLGPLRDIPAAQSLVDWGMERGATTDESLQAVDWRKGRAAWRELVRNPDVRDWPPNNERFAFAPLIDVVNAWLTPPQRLGMGYALRSVQAVTTLECVETNCTLPDGYPGGGEKSVLLYLWDTTLNLPISPDDVGTGVAQVVPVLVAVAMGRTGAFIEQPELHLHPRLQAQLADFFVSRVCIARQSSVVHRTLLETHSEHIALRLLRRIRETAVADVSHRHYSLRPEDVAFYYFESRDGATIVHRLRVDSKGRFVDRWPRGFFDERAQDLFDYAD